MENETLQQMTKKIDDLATKIEALEAWKTEKERQQLTYPLDVVSQSILLGSLSGTSASGTFTTFEIRNGLVLAAS